MNLTWINKHFSELTAAELYRIFHLRLEVFSIEQNCAYQDADGKDLDGFHLCGYNDAGELVAYSRILKAGVAFREASIGRVITSKKIRGTGTGKELMKRSLEILFQKFGNVPVRIGAQCYLNKFYRQLGFIPEGKEFLEDNIPHIEMVIKP